MDEASPGSSRIARLRLVAGQVRRFAEFEAERSGLPGQDQGPADAYRHLVGVAELSRRVGPLTAAAMAERNEWGSTEAMLRAILDGRPVAPSNTPAARRMDRHNNLLAVGIGATASSTEEVVMRARTMMEQAIQTKAAAARAIRPLGAHRSFGPMARRWPTGRLRVGPTSRRRLTWRLTGRR